MKIDICTINHNDEGKRVTISYDPDERKLYADDEIIDTPELPTIGAAEEHCYDRWGVDPVGVWDIEWIERDEPQAVIRYEIKTDSIQFCMGDRRDLIPAMTASEIVNTHLSCDGRITSNSIDPELRESFCDEAEARAFFAAHYSNYGRTRLERIGGVYYLTGEIAWLEVNEYDEDGNLDQGGDVLAVAAEPYAAEDEEA